MTCQRLALVAAGICLSTLTIGCFAAASVERSPRDPLNPTLWVNSFRKETTYSGPLHHFDAIYGMHHISLKQEMGSGDSQCYYFPLIEGYQLNIYASSISSAENRFHMLMANSDETFLKKFSDESSVSYAHNVTEPDTYEVCLINSYGSRQLMFSALYYLPKRYETELSHAMNLSQIATNITDMTAAYIGGIEVNMGKALNSIRYKPHLRRDYVALKASNKYVQWKAIAYIVLMLCSCGGTTLFIHHLFHVPKGKMTV